MVLAGGGGGGGGVMMVLDYGSDVGDDNDEFK
jgi:hypothetical protein